MKVFQEQDRGAMRFLGWDFRLFRIHVTETKDSHGRWWGELISKELGIDVRDAFMGMFRGGMDTWQCFRASEDVSIYI